MADLKLNSVSKLFGKDVYAAKNISFDVKDKEFAVLVGPSGCGKTTILRLIAGLEQCTSGTITIDKICVNDIPPKDRDVAMVFQNYALYPHMTVYDNMAFGLKMRNYPRNEIRERVMDTAQILGIDKLLERKPRQLSGGQRQRVAVGRAIVRQPKLFLFDEPLSNLDAKLRVQMRAELSRLHKLFETTVIYVTHDQVEAMTLGQRIIVLKDGEIQQCDKPTVLYKHPKNTFVAGFIGSPPMNFLQGNVWWENDAVVFRNGEILLPLDKGYRKYENDEIIIGIRPSDFSMHKGSPINLEVDFVEPMGSEVYVYGHCGKVAMSARLTEDTHPSTGETIVLKIDTKKLYIFDAKTEEALS